MPGNVQPPVLFFITSFPSGYYGVNTRMQYALTNNISLNIWGQYIFPGEQSPFSTYNPLFPIQV